MTKSKQSQPAKRRNAEARAAWRLGHRVKPPGTHYKRRPKHRKPRQDPQDHGGASASVGLFWSTVLAGSKRQRRATNQMFIGSCGKTWLSISRKPASCSIFSAVSRPHIVPRPAPP